MEEENDPNLVFTEYEVKLMLSYLQSAIDHEYRDNKGWNLLYKTDWYKNLIKTKER